ncbi:MAG TPA: ATP synthase F1 subunit delta [Myxococcota bacterium]
MRSPTVARRYARALFAIASESQSVDSVREELGRIAELVHAHPELRHALFRPLHPAAERRAVLRSVSARVGCGETVQNFLGFLVDQRRIVDYDGIRAEYQRLADAAAGRVRAEVVAASALDARQAERLRAALEAQTGQQVELEVRVDDALIAGAVAVVGGMVFDGSLRTQLSQLRDTLTRGQ